MKDLIIGAYTNYSWDKIKYWANSIDRCGFTGDKIAIVYNSDIDSVKKLSDLGFNISAFSQDPKTNNFVYPKDFIIVVERFLHLWSVLEHIPNIDNYRYVISTDVKDVVFQSNPSIWLEQNMGDKQICASSESLRYIDEPWGNQNLNDSYPHMYEKLKNNTIWNCGVQAGNIKVMKDLWLQIFHTCKAGLTLNPDQAAYNLLLNMSPYYDITKFVTSEDAWAAQAGTTVDPTKIERFRPHLLEAEPIWDGEKVCTSTGIPHVILHQWDRIPAWHEAIEKVYG